MVANLTQQANALDTNLTGISKLERRFLLLRMAGCTRDEALQFCGVERGSYENWLHHPAFQVINAQLPTYQQVNRHTALILLRRENVLSTILLEEKILLRMHSEMEAMVYDLLKTPIAKTIYEKLIREAENSFAMDNATSLTWRERSIQVLLGERNNSTGGIVDGTVITTEDVPQAELNEGQPDQES